MKRIKPGPTNRINTASIGIDSGLNRSLFNPPQPSNKRGSVQTNGFEGC